MRRYVGQFVLVGFVALIVLTVASLLASRRAGTGSAIREAKGRTEVLAHLVVEPRLTPSFVSGNEADLETFSVAMRDLAETESFAHIRVWTQEGLVLYSDQAGLSGTFVGLGDHAQEAFDSGEVYAEVSDLSDDENVLERAEGRLLEVYQPVEGPDGVLMMLEAYYPFGNVDEEAQRIWWDFLPAVLIPLVLLQLIQIPLAGRLARKVQHSHDDREALLQGVISASDNERKAIAHDLHDGAVQDLSGATYALSVVSERATRHGDERSVNLISGAQTDIRRSIQSLRSLFVEIYPPNLQRAGLHVALSDLLAALDGRGITTELTYPDGLELPTETNAVIYRITQEATRNVVRHANATRLDVELSTTDTTVAIRITDNGDGFEPDDSSTTRAGHLGLPIMADLATEVGGHLEIQSQQTSGRRSAWSFPYDPCPDRRRPPGSTSRSPSPPRGN